MEKISIYLIDDHKLFVEGIYSLLADEPGFELLGFSLSADHYLQKAGEINADVYLIDINMPEISGIELCKMIRRSQPGARLLALTMYDEYTYVEKMIQSGALGYILKTASLQELTHAIKTVSRGERYLASDIQAIVFNKIGTQQLPQGPVLESENLLTIREREILSLIVKEYTTPEIARKLFISERTVETHRKNIFSKTHVRSIVGLIRYAVQNGLADFNESR